MKRVLIVAVVFGWMAVPATTRAVAGEAALEARVQTLLVSFHKEFGFPGATVAYSLPDGTTGDAAVGLADVESDLAMTPETRMLAASIGKTMVRALVLSLESEGVLSRKDRISKYLGNTSWFSRLPNASEITVGQLLTHTAGLPDHVHMDAVAAEIVQRGNEGSFQPEDAIAYILDTTALFDAGSAWSYSDTGYLILGRVIESATERDFYDLVEDRFLRPLALDHTSPSTSPMLPGLAVGYTFEANPFALPPRTMDADGALLWNPNIEWTGGGFVSTSHDLAIWGHALFSGAALRTPYLDRLLDAVLIDPDAPGILYGSGVSIYSKTEFGPIYGHGGWVPGYVSSLRHYATHGITIAFQINSDVGVVDDSTDLVPAMEAALASLLKGAVERE